MTRGRLIVFEGTDGCGKSTQLERLADALARAGRDVVRTHEPTDGSWGRRIREMARAGERPAPAEELRWFVEDRREHVQGVIEPALAAGRIVLSDRYYLSSVAYQGARGLDAARILADSEAEFPRPDLAIVLVVPPARGLARVHARGGRSEPAFEELSYLERVAALFAGLACPYVVRVDGEGSVEEVQARVEAAVAGRLGAELLALSSRS